jgi:hypothetical protein
VYALKATVSLRFAIIIRQLSTPDYCIETNKIYLHQIVNKLPLKFKNKKRGYPFETASFL